jgi:hypothetical protein
MTQRYEFGRRNWRDPSSKYGLAPEQFEADVQQKLAESEEKQARVNAVLTDLINSDPARQEQTFQMIVNWAREWRRSNGRN